MERWQTIRVVIDVFQITGYGTIIATCIARNRKLLFLSERSSRNEGKDKCWRLGVLGVSLKLPNNWDVPLARTTYYKVQGYVFSSWHRRTLPRKSSFPGRPPTKVRQSVNWGSGISYLCSHIHIAYPI